MAGRINTWAEFQSFMDACCEQVGAEPDNAPHGRWWQGMSHHEFMTDAEVLGERIVVPGDPENSRIIQALEGRDLFGPEGNFNRMPTGTPFRDEDIAEIRDWVARGCPDGIPVVS